MGLSEIDSLAFKHGIPFNDVTQSITQIGEDHTQSLLESLDKKVKKNLSAVTVFRAELRHERISRNERKQFEDLSKDWKEGPSLSTNDIIGLVIVDIERHYAETNDRNWYETHWRYLLNIYPEAEEHCPQDVIQAVQAYRKEHAKDLMLSDRQSLRVNIKPKQTPLPF